MEKSTVCTGKYLYIYTNKNYSSKKNNVCI